MSSLAVKYRPQDFKDVVSQESIVTILNKQLITGNVSNCYLFAGPTGTGKTTIARIFANKINNGLGTPIEIDAASNNGVDNVRQIISDARERSLDATYKIYIIDEAHSITTQGWQAFLKCLEEPPKYTIFMFCTTDPQKIPDTIQNRVMRFNLNKIPTDDIENRLVYICNQEGFINYKESCSYIARLSCGGMRDAISMLDKASNYSEDLSINNVVKVTGNLSYETYLELVNYLVDRDEKSVLSKLNALINSGADLKVFVEQFLSVALDLVKYSIFKDITCTSFPGYLEAPRGSSGEISPISVKYATGFQDSVNYFNKLVDTLLDLKLKLRYDSYPETTVTACFIKISRGL